MVVFLAVQSKVHFERNSPNHILKTFREIKNEPNYLLSAKVSKMEVIIGTDAPDDKNDPNLQT
eukprot:UN11370